MKRPRNIIAKYDQDAHSLDISTCVVDAGTPLPEHTCGDCGRYIRGRLEENCDRPYGGSTGPLRPACRHWVKIETTPKQHTTMETKETPTTKVCKSCGRELPAEAFGRHARSRDGLQPYCKECRSKLEKGNPKYGRPKKDGTVSIPAAHAEEVRAFVEGGTAANPSVKEIPDHDLAQELRRRGYDVKCTKTVEL